MLDIASLFIGSAWAQTAAVVPQPTAGSEFMKFLPYFLILLVLYFFLIRPQQKKVEAQIALVKAIKVGDRVVTAGGIIGTIRKLEGDDYLMIEISKDVQIKILRNTVNNLIDDSLSPKTPTNTEDKKN